MGNTGQARPDAHLCCFACSNMTRETLNILKSREVIAINQDPLGVAGDLVWKQGPQEVTLCLIRQPCPQLLSCTIPKTCTSARRSHISSEARIAF